MLMFTDERGHTMRRLNWFAVVLGIMVIGFMMAPALAAPPQDVTVFGDSLSDPGNVFALTGDVSNTPYDIIPSAPYAVGGHHFSNGKTWIEQRPTQRVNATSSGPAYQISGVFTNYAVGGARARPDAAGLIEADLSVQVQQYLVAGAKLTICKYITCADS